MSEHNVRPAPVGPQYWTRIPRDQRYLPQWVLAAPGDKTPRRLNQEPASVINPAHWMAFEDAAERASILQWHIGFVLTKYDPFTCIDFDVKPNTPPDAMTWFWDLAQKCDSYAEVSAGGQGLHLWVRASMNRKGVRRFPLEVYSQERYIICTGNVVIDRPIRDRSEWVAGLIARMDVTGTRAEPMPDEPQVRSDYEVIDRISRSGQRGKAWALAAGHWQQYGYPSQSEADAALMGLLYGFTRNGAQLKRLFRMTALGQRPKAMKDDRYLDRSIDSIRQRRAVDPDLIAAMAAAMDEVIRERLRRIERERAAQDAMQRTLSSIQGYRA